MDLMGQLHRMNKSEVVEFVKSCQDPSGGFAPAEHHDPHLLYTLSAIQVYTRREQELSSRVELKTFLSTLQCLKHYSLSAFFLFL